MARANRSGFQLTPKRQQAALLVAEDRLGDRDIAAQVGIAMSTLELWKTYSEFRDACAAHRAALVEQIKAQGIADRQNRIDALNDRWRRMQQVIAERSEDPSLAAVPGGSTGLIVHDVKGIGKGSDFQMIDTYAVDTGLLKEFREHEKQAAQEVGQWTEKREVTGQDGAPLVFTIAIDRNEPDADSDS